MVDIPDDREYNEVDDDNEEIDESQLRGYGRCRACKEMKHDVLNDIMGYLVVAAKNRDS